MSPQAIGSPLRRSSMRRCATLFTFLATTGVASAFQEAPPPSTTLAWRYDTGEVQNDSSGPRVIASFTVALDGARWLRLRFDEIVLSGDPLAGTGSILRLTAHRDGAIQELSSIHCAQWRNGSAYFNGDAVEVDVVAQPGTGANRVVLAEVEAGLAPGDYPSICGPTDNRVLSNDPRAARLLPVGCSGWLIDDCNHCFLTAGHCTSVSVVQFNVPPSDSDGSINHPPPSDQYAVDGTSMQASATGLGDDWRYFGTFPNSVTGMTAAEAQGAWYDLELPPNFGPGQDIRITGYGVDSTPQTSNQVQQTHVGPRVSSSGTVLQYMTDTEGGNSGSPVLWEQGGTAIGIHTNGGCTSGGGSNSGTASSNSGLQQALASPLGVCAVGIVVVGSLPEVLAPGESAEIDLQIFGDVVPGSPTLFASYDGGPFLALPIAHVNGSFYTATLPPPVCSAAPRYFFSVVDASCGTLTLPDDAPQDFFSAPVGVETSVFTDDMESDAGWTGGQPGDNATTGTWVRVDPNGTEAQPGDDHSSPGTICWVTGQGAPGGGQGDNDVDGGITTLLSPSLDLAGLVDPVIDYWRWYSNDTGSGANTDLFVVEISNNGGGSWSEVETVGYAGPGTSGGWFQHQFRVLDVLAPSPDVRLRFVASDLNPGSIVEAALDDFRVRDVSCAVPLPDCNGNGILDSDDIASGRSRDGDGNGIPDECIGDCNGNGVPDDRDIANGTSADCNANDLPDDCELSALPYCFCATNAPCSNPDGSAGCANSTGGGALLAACGSDGVAADDLELALTNLPPSQSGILYMGPAQIQLPFGDGLRCVGAGGVGVFRFPIHNSGPGGTIIEGPGIVAHTLASFPPAGQIGAGSTWNFQGWYRDPAGPCGGTFNLSNAVSVAFAP